MRPRRPARSRLARSPFAFWLGAAALAALTALVVSRALADAGALAGRYGPLVPVVVAGRDVDAGVVVAGGDLTVREMPASLVPPAAIGTTADAVGRTALGRLVEGQMLLRPHLAPDGLRGVVALLEPGQRAVAVPAGGASAPVQRGDVVDVLATFDPSHTGGGDPTFPLAVGATVVEATDDLTTVAVGPEEALAIAYAVARGSVTLALTSPLVAPPPGGGQAQRRAEAATPTTTTPRITR